MNKRALNYVIAGAILLVPSVVMAQGFFGPLVPCDGPDCDACMLVTLANNILKFLIAFSVFAAIIAFTWAGFLMVTAAGNEGQITKAKNTFSVVAIGLIIVLASWLIVDTVLRLTERGGLNNWVNLICESGTVSRPTPSTGGGGGVVATPSIGSDELVSDTALFSHMGALGALASRDNISVTSTNGPQNVFAECNTTGCTSLEAMRGETINAVLSFSDRCTSCDVVVVGGTECGAHTAGSGHCTGDKVDIDDTSSVNNHVRTNFDRMGTRGDGAELFRDPETGAVWAFEGGSGAHWDVTRANAAADGFSM